MTETPTTQPEPPPPESIRAIADRVAEYIWNLMQQGDPVHCKAMIAGAVEGAIELALRERKGEFGKAVRDVCGNCGHGKDEHWDKFGCQWEGGDVWVEGDNCGGWVAKGPCGCKEYEKENTDGDNVDV